MYTLPPRPDTEELTRLLAEARRKQEIRRLARESLMSGTHDHLGREVALQRAIQVATRIYDNVQAFTIPDKVPTNGA